MLGRDDQIDDTVVDVITEEQLLRGMESLTPTEPSANGGWRLGGGPAAAASEPSSVAGGRTLDACAGSCPASHGSESRAPCRREPDRARRGMMRQYELVERVQKYDPSANEALLNRAYVYAMQAHGHQKRASGDPYFSHPLEVAAILTELKLDDATIAAALLHDVIEDTDVTRAEIDQKFGKEIGALVDGLTKIKKLDLVTKKAEQAENFRKLLVAISSDIRVLLIKLADRLHNMRTLEHMKPESRRRVSEETLEIYAPAGRPHGHAGHARGAGAAGLQVGLPRGLPGRASTSSPRSTSRTPGLVEEISAALKGKLADAGLEAEVYGREKKPFSIWRKMENRQISLEQLSDIYGFRVVVDDIDACYRALGIVHSAWRAVPGRFKDYISTPKQNNYQSIHTTIVGPRHQRVELQIRTDEMHHDRRIRRGRACPLQGRHRRRTNSSAGASAAAQPRRTPTSGCAAWSTRCSKATTPRSSWSTPSSSCSRTRCSASRPRAA